MAQPALMLGDVVFLQREVPDTINFGGVQMMAVHENLGGFRTIDAMGPSAADIHWSGHFLTVAGIPGTAASRARALDQMRKSGAQVWLYWGSFAYLVIVKHFTAVYKNEWQIAYHIVCTVVSDGPTRSFVSPAASLWNAIQNDLQTATGLLSAASSLSAGTVQTLQTALTSVESAINQATNGGAAQLGDLSVSQMQPVIAAANAALSVFQGNTPVATGLNLDLPSGASTLDGFTAFITEANTVAGEADVTNAAAYLGRIATNLTLALG